MNELKLLYNKDQVKYRQCAENVSDESKISKIIIYITNYLINIANIKNKKVGFATVNIFWNDILCE